METIGVRIVVTNKIIYKEFNKEKEAKKFISEEVKKNNDITRVEIQNDVYNEYGLLAQSHIKYFYEW